MLILDNASHLFKIKIKEGAGIIAPFELNKVQKTLHHEIQDQIKEKGKARIIVIKGRQQGITTYMQLLGLSYVLSVPAFNAYTMAHDAGTATSIFEEKIKFAFNNLPDEVKPIFKAKRDNVRQLMFEEALNGSNITVGLTARGTTQNFLHISEAGSMSMNPKLWAEMIEGSLPAAEHAQVIVIESTADGGKGAFYEMVQAALKDKNEYKVLFLCWTDSEEYQAEPPLKDDWIEDYETLALRHNIPTNPMASHGLNKKQFYWYYRTLATLGGKTKVQYPLDLDQAFETDIPGAYYQNEIDQMLEDGRFDESSLYAHNPRKLVSTWWDLAVSHDLNAVLFAQIEGGLINIIDYYERTGVPASVIASDLASKGYIYDRHFAPFDVNTKQMGETSLRTKKDIFATVGINFNMLGKTSVASGIEAVRLIFPRLRIHRNLNTELFMNRLRAYRSEDKQGTGLLKEVHDINSHAADALRYLAVSIALNKDPVGRTQVFNPNLLDLTTPIQQVELY